MITYTKYISRKQALTAAGGLVIGIAVSLVLGAAILSPTAGHPIGTSQSDQVHVHGDFQLYVHNERIRFTDEKYQSSTEHTHHPSLHFHDGNDEVIHRHADGVTLSDFFTSIGLSVTDTCLTLDTGAQYCTSATTTLLLLVNGEPITPITEYIVQEEDRILVYYGDPANQNIRDYVNAVTEQSCMYSGTCPEKGTPPTESCGLTCEVADFAQAESAGLWHTVTHWLSDTF